MDQHETRDLVIRTAADTARLLPQSTQCCASSSRTSLVPRFSGWKTWSAGHCAPGFYASAVACFAVDGGLVGGVWHLRSGDVGGGRASPGVRRPPCARRVAAGRARRAARCGATPTLLGLAAGVPLALVAGRLVREQLYGIGPTDWPTIILVVAVMSAVAVVAALAPAVRAARIEPAVVLNHETGG